MAQVNSRLSLALHPPFPPASLPPANPSRVKILRSIKGYAGMHQWEDRRHRREAMTDAKDAIAFVPLPRVRCKTRSPHSRSLRIRGRWWMVWSSSGHPASDHNQLLSAAAEQGLDELRTDEVKDVSIQAC